MGSIYFELIYLFIVLSITSFILNIIYSKFPKKGEKKKILGIISNIFTIIYAIVVGLYFVFFFYISKELLIQLNKYKIQIMIYNLMIVGFFFLIFIKILICMKNRENIIELELPSKSEANYGELSLGDLIQNNKEKYNFFLSIKDLEKHMFICGATGTGKTNFLHNFLINLQKIYTLPFLIVEFKGEYHFLQEEIKDCVILWPGKNFGINIFDPQGINPIIHAERIFDILKSGNFFNENYDFSPQMEKVLVEILVEVCNNRELRSWEGFEHICDAYLRKKQNSIPMLKQSLIGIKNRIRRYSNGPLRSLFKNKKEYHIRSIFNKKIIIDLSSIIRLGGDKQDALFYLNLLLKYLWDRNITKGAYNFKGIDHLTIIEDAQYFAPENITGKSKLTTYIEDIALLLRGTGECLITLSTRPDISQEILANAGIVVSFRNYYKKDLVAEILNLKDEQKEYLSFLKEGECILRVNSIKFPFHMKIPQIRRKDLRITKILQSNHRISECNINL
ncbi:MAG: DUF87 domain-containing protein [Candidatus Lokiarchaeota archaeon]|nr:DUF87 domain-containing protein [Candidatus Lokiarchaeota archaeon]MBD3201041.1 DUF87 domain-containing protein [Candidatus Lokiarchaeota archaeon]